MKEANKDKKDTLKGLAEGKILKEEQQDSLKKLLNKAGDEISPEDMGVLLTLVDELSSGAKRLKTLRKKAMPNKDFDSLMSLISTEQEPVSNEDRVFPLKNVPSQPPKPKSTPDRDSSLAETVVIEPEKKPEPPKPKAKSRKKPVSKPTPIVEKTPKSVVSKPTPKADQKPLEKKMVEKKEEAVLIEKKEISSADVVRNYVEAWNQQAFGVEYDCFHAGLFNMTREEYADLRSAVYKKTCVKRIITQKIERIYREEIKGDVCEVSLIRIYNTQKKITRFAEMYKLKKENSVWKIQEVETKIESSEKIPVDNSKTARVS